LRRTHVLAWKKGGGVLLEEIGKGWGGTGFCSTSLWRRPSTSNPIKNLTKFTYTQVLEGWNQKPIDCELHGVKIRVITSL
jgi:hypothetical protein